MDVLKDSHQLLVVQEQGSLIQPQDNQQDKDQELQDQLKDLAQPLQAVLLNQEVELLVADHQLSEAQVLHH